MKHYIAPHIGKIALAKLTADDVNRMIARLTARGDLSPTTVRYAVTVLRIALGDALRAKRVTVTSPARSGFPGQPRPNAHH